MSNESFRNQTATYQNGKRKWIYARQPKGKYYTYRSFVGWILFAFLLVAPFIRINENPLLMFNFLERRFSIFGSMFTPQDSFIFLVIMISFLLFIILFTAVYGRVFCGWICPQTIFMETIFRRLEYLIEGNAHRQQELNQRAWDAEKIIIKTLKYSVFFAISFLLSNLALIYLVGADEWLHRIQSPIVEYKTSFIVTFLFAVLIYTIYSLVREQLCLIVCPYGRLQGILLDSDSIVVSYDHKRCEDCLDDKLCVHVCPTGIDIRNGTQLECINCMACIDACNSVMKRANRSTGLIRLDSKRGILEGKSSIVRPRSIIYSILLVSILMFLVILLSCRNPFEVSVFRTQGTLYQEYDKGQISNMYNLKFINKTQDKQSIEVKLLSAKGSLQTMQRLDIEKYATGETVFLVYINRKEIDFEKIKLGIYANKKLIKTLETNFVSPR